MAVPVSCALASPREASEKRRSERRTTVCRTASNSGVFTVASEQACPLGSCLCACGEAEGTRLWSAGPDTPAMTSSPVSRVVYNGKRNSSPRSPPSSSEIFTPAHEENVRFIYEAWQGVERDLRSQMSGSERGLVEEYVEKVPNPSLKTFKPIDLSDLKRRNTPDAKKS
ncbi:mapk-regulated corepressor-interacting protein 1 isoform X2 [Mustela lutreola]|uniref:mapk-regulated corepressor-interacting protein 1 isoform X2 n=1 Tax=Mustela lutreola TaxID=9666 RepID=UPI0027979B37|nr:mapk-regulated corepressor-interacting protein 1 isoform X2 [Mustela lutreola]